MGTVMNRRESGMGPYYAGLWLWTRLGDSDVWIRSFSVLGSAVAVLLVFRLTLRWFSRWPAVIAATILLVSPFMHQYQTEARTYAWTMVVAVGMAFLGDVWVRRPSIVSSLGLGALGGVGVALSPLFVLWVSSFALAVVLAQIVESNPGHRFAFTELSEAAAHRVGVPRRRAVEFVAEDERRRGGDDLS